MCRGSLGPEGLQGLGAVAPGAEPEAKSSCTWLRAEECLFRRQEVELVPERLAAAEQGSLSPLFSLCILRTFALDRRVGYAHWWQRIDCLLLKI